MIEPIIKTPFSFDELVLVMTLHSDLNESFLNKNTGEILHHNMDSFGTDDEGIDDLGDEWVLIPTISSHEAYNWMEEFVDSVSDSILVDKLAIALNGKGVFRRFKDVLAGYPAQREAWFNFENKKILQEVHNWLEVTAPHLLPTKQCSA